MLLANFITANFVAVQVMAALGDVTCVDLSQTKCGKYGITFKYPGVEGGAFANVSAIDGFFQDVYAGNNADLNNQCGTSGIDVTKISGYESYFCLLTWNAYISTSGNTTGTSGCNNNQPLTFKNICKKDCETVLNNQAPYLKSQGCNKASLTTVNSTIVTNICASAPVDNCASLTFSAAINLEYSLYPAVVAMLAFLFI